LSLDFKLGFRMLVKYPGLTIVGGLAMAFGIWFGAVTFEMFGMLSSTKLPLPDGDRIVRIRNRDIMGGYEPRSLHDLQLWRRTLRSVTDLGAYRDVKANLVGADGNAQPVEAAEITASAFRIAPDRPLLGRALDTSDERAGASPVIVLGYDVWQERFDGNLGIVGRNVQIGSNYATVVGVMAEGYAFPVSHELWIPFRTDIPGIEPRTGPAIVVFGRLAPGMTLEAAQAELTSLGKRAATEFPATHAQLQPRVYSYVQSEMNSAGDVQVTALINFFVIMLVVVMCSNVALLLFARAASREAEIIVRSALGASRRRIMMQLFAEALVLGGVAVVAGLAAAQLALNRLGRPYLEVFESGRLPFWYDFSLSATTVLYACALAVLGAVIAGIMPARKITRGLGSRLRAGTAGGGGVSFGGVWTAVIIVQVALTVALPAVVLLERNEIRRIESYDAGFAAAEYLGVRVTGPALPAVLSASLEMLRQRLEAEAAIAGVTFVDRLPRDNDREHRTAVVSLPGNPTTTVATAWIDPSYFDVLAAPVLVGRNFNSSDLVPEARVVIVDQVFVETAMEGRNPVGHRVRVSEGRAIEAASAQLPWYEIIGVVKELGMTEPARRRRRAGLYFPAVPGSNGALHLIVHARGEPSSIAPRVRELATVVDPTLRIESITRLDQVANPTLWFLRLWMRITIGLTAIALLLSLTGIYAVLSYTVARRTREIGVRVALGASARRVITAIFWRPLTQVVIGVVAGGTLVGLAAMSSTVRGFTGSSGLTLGDIALLVAYAVLMLAVSLLACVIPTWRALSVQPTEALRAE
jgi:predicted permease